MKCGKIDIDVIKNLAHLTPPETEKTESCVSVSVSVTGNSNSNSNSNCVTSTGIGNV